MKSLALAQRAVHSHAQIFPVIAAIFGWFFLMKCRAKDKKECKKFVLKKFPNTTLKTDEKKTKTPLMTVTKCAFVLTFCIISFHLVILSISWLWIFVELACWFHAGCYQLKFSSDYFKKVIIYPLHSLVISFTRICKSSSVARVTAQ